MSNPIYKKILTFLTERNELCLLSNKVNNSFLYADHMAEAGILKKVIVYKYDRTRIIGSKVYFGIKTAKAFNDKINTINYLPKAKTVKRELPF